MTTKNDFYGNDDLMFLGFKYQCQCGKETISIDKIKKCSKCGRKVGDE